MKLFVLVLALLSVARCQQAPVRLSDLVEANRQALAKTLASYADAKNKMAKDLTTLVDSTKNIQASVTDMVKNMPTDLMLGRFYEGYSRQMYASEALKSVDPFVTKVIVTALLGYGGRGATVFSQCFTNNVANNLVDIIDSVSKKLAKLDQEELAFKSALDSCGSSPIIISRTVDACTSNVLAKYPKPVSNSTGYQTVESMNQVYACIDKAANEINRLAEAGVNAYKNAFEQKYQYLFVKKFESYYTPPIAFPSVNTLLPVPAEITNKLEAVERDVAIAAALQAQAANSKVITFDVAKDFLQPQIQRLGDYMNQAETPSTALELDCYTTAKIFYNFGINIKASNLINCINGASATPSVTTITYADNAVKVIQAKENVLWSSVDCARVLNNVFDPYAMERCLEQARTEILQKLDVIKLRVQIASADSLDVLRQVKRCKCQAATELRKEARKELGTLEQCLIKTTKVRVQVPKEVCIINDCV